jgi:hypothetical protein
VGAGIVVAVGIVVAGADALPVALQAASMKQSIPTTTTNPPGYKRFSRMIFIVALL